MKRNHKDIEWKQLFFEIPVFFGPPCMQISTEIYVRTFSFFITRPTLLLSSIEKYFWFWNKFGAAIWKHVAIKKSSALFNFKYLYTNRKYYVMGFQLSKWGKIILSIKYGCKTCRMRRRSHGSVSNKQSGGWKLDPYCT